MARELYVDVNLISTDRNNRFGSEVYTYEWNCTVHSTDSAGFPYSEYRPSGADSQPVNITSNSSIPDNAMN